MKISYTSPTTEKRTSITLSNAIIRLWAISRTYDTESDDFMSEQPFRAALQQYIIEQASNYQPDQTTFETLVSYVENAIVVDAESLIRSLLK
jgi:hypothetical protein